MMFGYCSYIVITMIYRGGSKAIERIQVMFEENPKRHMYDITNEKHMINAYNTLK